jgi:hypothetical protein
MNPYENIPIRSVWNKTDKKLYFAVIDIVRLFSGTPTPKDYIKKRRKYDAYLSQVWDKIVLPLPLETNGGKQILNCVNVQGALIIIQSIPSLKAMPLKIWLAKAASEQAKKRSLTKLLTPKTKKLYVRKGYHPDQWIENRMKKIVLQKDIKIQDIKESALEEQLEYSQLKGEISRAAFDISISDSKNIKGFKYLNIQDINTDLDLIFCLLGEASTLEVVLDINATKF